MVRQGVGRGTRVRGITRVVRHGRGSEAFEGHRREWKGSAREWERAAGAGWRGCLESKPPMPHQGLEVVADLVAV